jgi:hypothetical protein
MREAKLSDVTTDQSNNRALTESEFVSAVRARDGIAARLAEFTVLTNVRTSSALNAA